jgi:hypothetical protein
MAEGTRSQGTERIFDRETLLDLTVNFIPLGIILFFIVLFALFRPFGVDLVATVISMGLLIIPFTALAILTYFAGKVISEAEKRGKSETAESVAEAAIGIGEGEADEASRPDASTGTDDPPAVEGAAERNSDDGAGNAEASEDDA